MDRTNPYQTIIVGTDFGVLGRAAVHAAVEAAELLGAVRIHVVHVVSRADVLGSPPAYSEGSSDMLARAEQWARSAATEHLDRIDIPSASVEITREVRVGPPARELVAAADQQKADLLVVATHGRGVLGRVILGSLASNLIRIAPCPVLVAGRDRKNLRDIVRVFAAVDLSPGSEPVLRAAMDFNARAHARLHVLSVYEPPGTAAYGVHPTFPANVPIELTYRPERHRRMLEDLVRTTVAGAVDVGLHAIPAVGRAADTILDELRKRAADLVVIGTSGHNAFERVVLGSTANHVIAEAPCPVLVVPSRPSP